MPDRRSSAGLPWLGKLKAVLIAALGLLVSSKQNATRAESSSSPANERPPTQAGVALLGAKLADAKKTDFFTFFHLEESGPAAKVPNSGGTQWTFKPSGAAFRELVTVEVWVSAADRIEEMHLTLAREFIAHPQNGRFANDIAKSFLRSALPKDDQVAVADLLNEIEYRPPPGDASRMIVGPNYKPPRLPAEPTPGFRTYRGEQPEFRVNLPHGWLRMNNLSDSGRVKLEITVR